MARFLKDNGSWSSEPLVQSDNVVTLWSGTQQEYDAIQVKDPSTLYIVKDE